MRNGGACEGGHPQSHSEPRAAGKLSLGTLPSRSQHGLGHGERGDRCEGLTDDRVWPRARQGTVEPPGEWSLFWKPQASAGWQILSLDG